MDMEPPIPEDIFNRTTRPSSEMRLAIMFYALWIREKDGRTFDQWHRKMKILSGSISNRVSALIKGLGNLDGELPAILRRDRATPTMLTTQLKGMGNQDKALRGHFDRFCKIPLGMEFVMSLLAVIAAEYRDNPAMLSLYSILSLWEYMLGTRTHEALIKTGLAYKPYCLPVDGDINLLDPTWEYVETSASIHSATWKDIQFMWADGRSRLGHEQLYDDCPDCFHVYGTTKNNPTGTKHPSTIMVNPHFPGSANVCLVKELHTWARSLPQRQALQFVFLGAHELQFNQLIKQTARVERLPDNRCFPTGLRIGCESATTSTLMNMTSEQVQVIVQHHQNWRTLCDSAPYHVNQLVDGVIKTILLLHLGTTTLEHTRLRYCRFNR